MTSYGHIIVDSCIISFILNYIMQSKLFYNIATKVSSRKKCYYFWWSTWLITRIRLLQTAPTISSRSLRTESCQVVKPPVTIKLKSWQFSIFISTHQSYCLTLLPMNIHRNLTDVMQITQNWDPDRVQPKNHWHGLHFVVFCLSSALVDFTNITQGLT